MAVVADLYALPGNTGACISGKHVNRLIGLFWTSVCKHNSCEKEVKATLFFCFLIILC